MFDLLIFIVILFAVKLRPELSSEQSYSDILHVQIPVDTRLAP